MGIIKWLLNRIFDILASDGTVAKRTWWAAGTGKPKDRGPTQMSPGMPPTGERREPPPGEEGRAQR